MRPLHHTYETRRLLSRQCRKFWTPEKRAAHSVAVKESLRQKRLSRFAPDSEPKLLAEIILQDSRHVLRFVEVSVGTGHEDVALGDVFVGSIVGSLPQYDGPVTFSIRLPGLQGTNRKARSRTGARAKIAEAVAGWLGKTSPAEDASLQAVLSSRAAATGDGGT